jgi:hypothetical protein
MLIRWLHRSIATLVIAHSFAVGQQAYSMEYREPAAIWDALVPSDQHEPMVRYFRGMVDLEAAPAAARLRLMGQDAGEVFVNGSRVGTWTGWTDMPLFEVSHLLRAGRNVIAVRVERGTTRLHPSGYPNRRGQQYALLGRMRGEYADGRSFSMETGGEWQASAALPRDWPLASVDDGWGATRAYSFNQLWDYTWFRGNEEFAQRIFELSPELNKWDRNQLPRPLGPVAPTGREPVAGIGPSRQYLVDQSGRSVYWLGLGTQLSIGYGAAVSPTFEHLGQAAESWYGYLGSWGMNGNLLFVGEPWTASTEGYVSGLLNIWDRLGYSVMALPIMNRTLFEEMGEHYLGKRFLETTYNSDIFFPESPLRAKLNQRFEAVIRTLEPHRSAFSLSLHDEAFYWPRAGSPIQENAWREFLKGRYPDLAAVAEAWGDGQLSGWEQVTLSRALASRPGSSENRDLGKFRNEVILRHLEEAARFVRSRSERLLITKNFNNWTNWLAKAAAARIPELDLISLNNFSHRLYEFAGQIRFCRVADRPFLAPSVRADTIAIGWTSFLMGAAGSAPFYDPRWFLYATREEIEQTLHLRRLVDEVDLANFTRARPTVAVLYVADPPPTTDASDLSNPTLQGPEARAYVQTMRALDAASIDYDHIDSEAEVGNYQRVIRPGTQPLAALVEELSAAAVAAFPPAENLFAYRLAEQSGELAFFMIGSRSLLDDGRTASFYDAANPGSLDDETIEATLRGLKPDAPLQALAVHPMTGERREFELRSDAAGSARLKLPAFAREGFLILRLQASLAP